MSEMNCEQARIAIPSVVSGRADAEQRDRCLAHAESCSECGAELELARLLFDSRITAPDGLADRVAARAIPTPTRTVAPWWAASAAAVAALALGIGMNAETGTVGTDAPGFAIESEEGELWSSDDGLIAGGPTLDGLSDEALAQLLDELMTGSSGGAA